MLTKQEINAILQIIGRSDFKGEEILGMAGLINKLHQIGQEEEKSTELKPVKKEAK
jgi:hypothetical protein